MSQPSNQTATVLQWLQQGNRPLFLGTMLLLISAIAYYAIMQQAEPRMCSLFEDYQITRLERQQILIALGAANLEGYVTENDRILVPTNERARFLAKIKEHEALPRAFAQQEKFNPNLLLPNSQVRRIEQERRKQKVCQLILKLPFVEEAWFEMDCPAPSTMFEQVQQSAVVMVKPRRDAVLNHQQVETIQQLVSAAFASMDRQSIAVIDSNEGVAYRDLNDNKQSQRIEAVNWTRSRREHYLQKLKILSNEYPGIELEVEVDRIEADEQRPLNDRIASQTDRQDSRLPTTAYTDSTDSAAATGIGLNQGAEIRLPKTQNPATGQTRRVGYQQAVPANGNVRESVRIAVRVPQSTLSRIESPNPEGNGGATIKFDRLKQEIVAKIRQLVPVSSLADAQAISVLLMDADVGLRNQNRELAIVPMIHQYWPAIFGVVLALFGVFWSRIQTRQQVALSAAPSGSPTTLATDPLQEQLSNLIDSDPDTAAQVLRNWIKQAD
jgi:hypothetical protein